MTFTSQTVSLATDAARRHHDQECSQLLQGRDTLTGEQASLLSWFSHKMADMAEDRPASGQVCINSSLRLSEIAAEGQPQQ